MQSNSNFEYGARSTVESIVFCNSGTVDCYGQRSNSRIPPAMANAMQTHQGRQRQARSLRLLAIWVRPLGSFRSATASKLRLLCLQLGWGLAASKLTSDKGPCHLGQLNQIKIVGVQLTGFYSEQRNHVPVPDGHPHSRIADFIPWRFCKASSQPQ